MEKINYNDWEEENSSTPILIRANNHSDLLACSSIFALHYPEQIKIGAKYFMDFGPPNDDDTMKLLDQGSHSELVHDLRKDELVVEPNRIVFINIELQNESIKSYFDVVVNLTENSFPFVGILERWKGKWERLGDPLGQALETYNALATYFHYKVPSEPPYPMIAEEETGNNRVVRIHLLPKPLQGRSFNLPSERAELVTLREYVLKITIEQNDHHDEDPSERHAKKRSKIS